MRIWLTTWEVRLVNSLLEVSVTVFVISFELFFNDCLFLADYLIPFGLEFLPGFNFDLKGLFLGLKVEVVDQVS